MPVEIIQVPDNDGGVPAARGGRHAVGGQGDTVNRTDLEVVDRTLAAGFDVPDPHGLVPADREQVTAIPREADLADPACVARQKGQFRLRLQVPEPDLTVVA